MILIKGKKYPIKWSYKVLIDYLQAENLEYVDEAYAPLLDWLGSDRIKTSTLVALPKIVRMMIENAGDEIDLSDAEIVEDLINSVENANAVAKEIERASPRPSDKEDKKKAKSG